MNVELDINSLRQKAKGLMDYMKNEQKVNNINEAYIISDLLKSAIQHAQPEVRRLNPTIDKIKQEIFKQTQSEEENE